MGMFDKTMNCKKGENCLSFLQGWIIFNATEYSSTECRSLNPLVG